MMNSKQIGLFCLLFSLFYVPLSSAESLVFSSKQDQVMLLELYTSQGCSSCPRADRWLNQLTDDSRLWRDVIPLAFHVDYWDYLGWQDKFAQAQFSQRQRLHKRQGNVSSVYTPGFVTNGEEWKGWFYFPRLNTDGKSDVGNLLLSLQDGSVDAVFKPTQSYDKSLQLHVAQLGFDLETSIRAGENRGEKLRHEFVVMDMKTLSPQNKYHWETRWDKAHENVSAIVAWVSEKDSLKPIQAVGGWLK